MCAWGEDVRQRRGGVTFRHSRSHADGVNTRSANCTHTNRQQEGRTALQAEPQTCFNAESSSALQRASPPGLCCTCRRGR